VYAIFVEAVRDFFRQALWGGQEVPVVFASPDRAHEEMRRVIRRRRAGVVKPGVSGTAHADEDRPPPAPYMSVYMTAPQYQSKYFNPGSYVVSKDYLNGMAVIAKYPYPMQAQVQVDLWCGTEGGNLIAYTIEPQIELRFVGGHFLLPIDWSQTKWYKGKAPLNALEHAQYYGRTMFPLYSNGWRDTTQLEPGSGLKQVRRTWSGHLDGFLPFRAEEARLVLRVVAELIDAGTEEVYAKSVYGVL